jgi:hypothetical protein
LVQGFDGRKTGMGSHHLNITSEADFYVFFGEIVFVDKDLANLVGGLGIFAFFRVVVLEQELAVAVLDDRLGVALDLIYNAEYLGDLMSRAASVL